MQFLLSGACLPHDDQRAKATSVAEVNSLLDRLAQADKKEQQARCATRGWQLVACCKHMRVFLWQCHKREPHVHFNAVLQLAACT